MKNAPQPQIISRDDHCISRKNISSSALKVLYRLNEKGFIAYLAGGAVRDLLLNKKPHDFDIVTNATPEQIRSIFNNCRIVGRRFRLAHVLFKREIIETSTFRASVSEDNQLSENNLLEKDSDGLLIKDNLFGLPHEDALRRDFTINALFYNIKNFEIIDYTNGLNHLEKKVLKVIGDPQVRFTEDPVRMIRAIRFSGTLDFKIDSKDFRCIQEKSSLLKLSSSSRMYDEIQKLFLCGRSEKIYEMLDQTNLIKQMFVNFSDWIDIDFERKKWITSVLKQLDKWKKADLRVDASLMLALLFGEYHECMIKKRTQDKKATHHIIKEVVKNHLFSICDQIRIPKIIIFEICDIMTNQYRLNKKNEIQGKRFIHSSHFANAFIYFKFSSKINKNLDDKVKFWENLRKK